MSATQDESATLHTLAQLGGKMKYPGNEVSTRVVLGSISVGDERGLISRKQRLVIERRAVPVVARFALMQM